MKKTKQKGINFKLLLSCVGEYKKTSVLTPIFMVFEAICECLIPYMMTKMLAYDSAGNVPMKQIYVYGAVLIGLAICSLTSGVLAGRFAAIASCGFAKNLRKKLFYAVQDFSFKDVDKFSTSSLVTRLTTDVTNIQSSYQMCLRIVVRVPLMFAFSIIMSMTINWKLAIIFVCVLPLLAAGLATLMIKVMPFFRKIFKKYDALNNSVQEDVAGIRVVKSFVREDYEKDKFDKAASDVRKDFTKAEKMIALTSPMMMMSMYLTSLLISFFGAKMVIGTRGAFSPAELSAVITYGVQMLSALMMFAMIMVFLTMSIESGHRITEVLEQQSQIVSPENAVEEVKDGSIVFDNVNFKYSEDAQKYALTNINLNIKSGETIGIIGGTGTSKTTLIQLIPRLYDVSTGSVSVGGVNVKDYDLNVLRKEVSVVLQKNVLFSGTIKDNLRWGNPDATDEELVRVCKLAQCHDFITANPDGYDRFIEQGGTNVSGGQKQRLCIARAILRKPKILIFDDSTSAVDTKTDALIRKALREEIPDTTKIIIAQRISSVEDADKIIIMNNGKIDSIGNHEELMKTSEIYREIYETQTRSSNVGGEQ